MSSLIAPRAASSIAIGIDPGKSGGIAVLRLNDNGGLIGVTVAPFGEGVYRQTLATVADSRCVCCVEKVHAMPGQGVTSMFNFGHNLGLIEGLLQAFLIPYQLVPPQTWKKEYSLSSDKSRCIEVAKNLFPAVNLLATPRSRKDHDGMAEALLMAEYARRRMA